MEMNLNPAGGAGDILTMILSSPTLHEAHPNRAHLSQLVHDFKAVVHGLGEQLGEELVVEDLETAAAGDLADRGGVKPMLIVAVPAPSRCASWCSRWLSSY